MSSFAEEHVLYRIANAVLREHPYPHLYVEDVFPADYYSAMRAHWPGTESLHTLDQYGRVPEGAYPERFAMPLDAGGIGSLPPDKQAFWGGLETWMLTDHFVRALVDKFKSHVEARFERPAAACQFECEALVVRDRTNYAIGPHTDSPHRLLSLLFYCPDDDRRSHLGTSIYAPKDPQFRCRGGPHYPHDWFNRVVTMPYRPNSLFAFFKTDHSFHGVEKIEDADVERDVLLYDIRVPKSGPDRIVRAAQASGGGMGLGLKLLKGLWRGRKPPSGNQENT
ncbi:MAG: hypothetical protein ACREUW_09345 [Burkholderiales bacterium]